MNCPKCNQPIPPSQSFCGRCGTKIQQTPRQPYQGGAPVTPKNNRTPLIIAIVVISVIAVGALIAVLILALNGKDDSSDAAKSSSPVESQAESLIESLSESSAVESRVEPSENSKAEDSKKQNNSNSKPGYVIRPTDPDFISGKRTLLSPPRLTALRLLSLKDTCSEKQSLKALRSPPLFTIFRTMHLPSAKTSRKSLFPRALRTSATARSGTARRLKALPCRRPSKKSANTHFRLRE